eukprot:scaffold71378_cov66-Phaeocystis_antarctica.AAC.3
MMRVPGMLETLCDGAEDKSAPELLAAAPARTTHGSRRKHPDRVRAACRTSIAFPSCRNR